MNLVQTVAPTSEPVTLAEAKQWLREDNNEQDAIITDLIVAARSWVENWTHRQLMTATWRMGMDRFPGDVCSGGSWDDSQYVITLHRPPLQSVSSIAYVDTNGSTQTWSSANYAVDTYSEPAGIRRAYGVAWPDIRAQKNAVLVTYIAGYASAALVPQPIKVAMKQLVTHWYDSGRSASTAATVNAQTTFAVESLLWPYYVPGPVVQDEVVVT